MLKKKEPFIVFVQINWLVLVHFSVANKFGRIHSISTIPYYYKLFVICVRRVTTKHTKQKKKEKTKNKTKHIYSLDFGNVFVISDYLRFVLTKSSVQDWENDLLNHMADEYDSLSVQLTFLLL